MIIIGRVAQKPVLFFLFYQESFIIVFIFTGSLMTSDTQPDCNCPLKCQYTTYDYSISTGSYPSEFITSQMLPFIPYDKEFVR